MLILYLSILDIMIFLSDISAYIDPHTMYLKILITISAILYLKSSIEARTLIAIIEVA